MDEHTENIEDIEVVYLDNEDEFDLEGMQDVTDHFQSEEESEQTQLLDLSRLTFMKHSKSVFCGNLNKNGQLAVTGGEDDVAYVWSTVDGDIKFDCTGHKDSVTSVCFNHDGQLLATGDMAGMIQVWSVKENKLIWCYEGDELEWLMWHTSTNVLMCGSQSGDIFIWQIPQGHSKLLPSFGSSCTCARLLPDGKQIIAGYEDGQIKLWDIKTVDIKWSMLQFQKKPIISIEINVDGSLCSVAPSSSILKISDGKLLGTLLSDGETEIETHVFHNNMNFLITGSLTGRICVWDLSKRIIRHQVMLDCGITTLKLDLTGQVFIGCIGGTIYVCDVKTGSLIETLTGHKSDILSMCISDDYSFLLTTSDDQTAKIFNVHS